MTDNEKAAYVAEKLLGWKPSEEYDGFWGPDWLHDDADLAFWRPFRPYESADDDCLVLKAVRDTPSFNLHEQFRGELYCMLWSENILQYTPGEYTDAAHAVLQEKGEK